MKRYSASYENGKCPMGYEFVEGYTSRGIWHDSYCRKIKKLRFDPEQKRKEKELQDQSKIKAMLFRDSLTSEPYPESEEDLGE
jgi:hypothetical protein